MDTNGGTANAAVEQGAQVAGTAAEQGAQVASTAAEQTKEVASTATQGASEVLSTVAEQIGEVRTEVAGQARNLIDESKSQLQQQAQSQTDKIADSLRRIGDELTALAEGRVEEASTVVDYARQAAGTVQRYAGRIEQRGYEGVIDDVQRFARRRPGTFLLGALAAGFGLGRLLRNAQSQNDGQFDGQFNGQGQLTPGMQGGTMPAVPQAVGQPQPQQLGVPGTPFPTPGGSPTLTDGTVVGMAASDTDAPVPPSVSAARATGALPGSDT